MLAIFAGFLLQAFLVAAAVELAGAIVYACAMAWTEHRRASYRWKQRMSPGQPLYQGSEWITRPLAWPVILAFRFFDWCDELLDAGDEP
jgi:hypothetical protein